MPDALPVAEDEPRGIQPRRPLAARTQGRQAGREPVFTQGPTSPDLVGDIGPMTRLLGAPRTTFAEGLKQTLVPA